MQQWITGSVTGTAGTITFYPPLKPPMPNKVSLSHSDMGYLIRLAKKDKRLARILENFESVITIEVPEFVPEGHGEVVF